MNTTTAKPTPGPWIIVDNATKGCVDSVRSMAFQESNMMGDYRGCIVSDISEAHGGAEMNAFRTLQEADRFANRAKHREFDQSDIEAVWFKALRVLQIEGHRNPSQDMITARCIRILENPE